MRFTEDVIINDKPLFLGIPDNWVTIPRMIEESGAYVTTLADGRKVVLQGTIFPANDATAIGIVFQDIEVTYGDVTGSIFTAGHVRTDRLPVAPTQAAIDALKLINFIADDMPVTGS